MSVEVEIVLRVPRVKEAIKDASGYPISNHDVRFLRRIVLQNLPTVGDSLQLTMGVNQIFAATVNRVEWHDGSNMFKVFCQYSQRAIQPPHYLTLTSDPEWIMKPLI